MKNRLFLIFLTIVTTLLLNGCAKTGPEGPAGINADVTTSPWITSPGWTWDTTNSIWYFDVNNSAITQDIVENGIILAYANIKGDIINDYTVRPLPAVALNATWNFVIPNDGKNYGTIEFETNLSTNPGTVDYFRYVLIPSGYILKSDRLKSMSVADIKKMPYTDVCKLLGIKE